MQVEGESDTLLEKASLVAYGVSYPDDTKRMALEVNETRWWLLQQMATLKVKIFGFYCQVLHMLCGLLHCGTAGGEATWRSKLASTHMAFLIMLH